VLQSSNIVHYLSDITLATDRSKTQPGTLYIIALCFLQQMEVTFDSMADWEAFLSSVPFQDHKAWTQRIQSMVVDGSPVWQVQRSVPLTVTASSLAAAAATAGVSSAGVSSAAARGSRSGSAGSSSIVTGGVGKLVITDQVRMG
jgi:hypothetical protein